MFGLLKRGPSFAGSLALVLALMFSASNLEAWWTNGNFENGLTGWSTLYFYGAPAANTQSGTLTGNNANSSATSPGVGACGPGNTGGNGGGGGGGCSDPYIDVVPSGQNPISLIPGTQNSPAWGSGGGLILPFAGAASAQVYSGNGAPHGYGAWLYQSSAVPVTACCLIADVAAVLEGDHYLSGNPYDSDAYVNLQVTLGTGPGAGPILYNIRFSWFDNLTWLLPAGLGNTSCGVNCPGSPGNKDGPWKYLPWTPQTLNLCAYIGQTVTLSYWAVSCYAQEHYAFGY